MAMTAQVKSELASTQTTKTCCRKAEVATMLRFAGGLHIVNGKIVVEAELDTGAAARRLRTDVAEVYGHQSDVVVVQGSGRFRNGEAVHPFGPGDLLFVPAGVVHRFEDFTDDLAVWVVFYGPEGGEVRR